MKTTSQHHGKILIVDDQEPNVLLLEQMLRKAGYDRVSSTRDPTQVCELHLVNQYDLILLDLNMPVMDGFAVLENLKALEQNDAVPVLVITAQPEHKLRALQAGARDFVSKPFELAEVLVRVRNQLEVRLLQKETRRLYEEVVAEQKVSARLLLDVLPAAVVERLTERAGGEPEAFTELVTGSYAEVTMLFADLLAFTQFAKDASAQVLTGVLDELSGRLEGGARRSDVIGDAWVATVGLPDVVATHTIRSAQKAVELKSAIERFNRQGPYKLNVRIGLDTSPALGAAVRKAKKRKQT